MGVGVGCEFGIRLRVMSFLDGAPRGNHHFQFLLAK